MLKKRILTALVLIPLVLAAIYLLPPWLFSVAVGLVVVLAGWEWAALCGFKSKQSRVIYIAVLISIFLSMSFIPESVLVTISIVSGAAIGWWLWSLLWLIRYQRRIKIIHRNRFAFALNGIFVLIPFWFGLGILDVEQAYQFYLAKTYGLTKPQLLLFLISIIALADTSAYFIGKKWGKRRLASRISPGKTWEGFAGSLITVGFFTPILAHVLHIDKFDIIRLSILVFVTVIASVLGDLFESLVKRLAGVKDSGTLLPGHGGILDRIDSYTAAVPIFMAGYFFL